MSAWDTGSAVIQAGCAAALTWFAGVQLLRERSRLLQSERSAQARISAVAYRLSRRLERWVGESDDEFDQWIRGVLRAQKYAQQIDEVHQWAHAMMDLLGDAPKGQAEGVRRVFVLVHEGTLRMSEYVEMGEPHGVDVFKFVDMRKHAAADLRDAIRVLREEVVERHLSSEEAALSKLRYDDSFEGNTKKLAQLLSMEPGELGGAQENDEDANT